jgi:hypothetical protein
MYEYGGPAFPQPMALSEEGNLLSSLDVDEGGMTLRDYFAAHAMPVVVQSPECAKIYHTGIEGLKTLASDCYTMADAMIAERNGENYG